MEEVQKLKNFIVKIVDFAYAISLDEKSSSKAGIACTMSEEIQQYAGKALETLTGMVAANRIF
jgi:hypothetical protein